MSTLSTTHLPGLTLGSQIDRVLTFHNNDKEPHSFRPRDDLA